MAGAQLRLLLWKDYLVRRRNPITLAGVLWAVGVIASICIVRFNIDNQEFPTCQFAARALPSAGLLTFLQSFVCNVNNDCSPLHDYQEIPTYENSKLTQLKRQLAPIIYNETVIDVAGSIPDALKLMATLADVADEPAFIDIAKNGIYVKDVFVNPSRARRELSQQLDLPADVAASVLSARIGLGAIMEGNIDRCSEHSVGEVIRIQNSEHLKIFVEKLCSQTKDDLQKLMIKLLFQMDIGKYVKMAGNMYYKVSGDSRLARLGDTARAALRLVSTRSFLPPELNQILYGDDQDFSYVHTDMLDKLVNLFRPTFGNTESFKTIKDFTDTAILGVKYLGRVLKRDDTIDSKTSVTGKVELEKVSNVLNNAVNVAQEMSDNDAPIDVFHVLIRITNLVLKFLPKKQKHDLLFYSTLVSKLVEVADEMVNINTNVEQLIHEVSLRNPKGVRVLLSLPLPVVSKGLEGLADPERTQIITSNLANPGQPFCDVQRISKFFVVSNKDASDLKTRLCTEDWKSYVMDMITSFGTYKAKNRINDIASIVVMDAIGSDVSQLLYTIDKDFEILKNFTQLIANLDKVEQPALNWDDIFNQKKDAAFLKLVKEKEGLTKHILLSVHGCLAKEVVKQNPLLEYKVSPLLKDTTSMVEVVNNQLKMASKDIAFKEQAIYPTILKVLALTAFDENKTYKSLSTSGIEIFCRGFENATSFLNLPPGTNSSVIDVLCDVTNEIDSVLSSDSVLSKGIAAVKIANHSVIEEINWTKLIKGLKELYITMEQHYPYVLQFRNYGMDNKTQEQIEQLFMDAKNYWFNLKSLKRTLLLTLNVGLRIMDLLDYEAFNLTQEVWLKMKYYFTIMTGPLDVINDFIEFLHGISKREVPHTAIPAQTASVLNIVLPSVPQLLVETVDIIVKNNVEVEPVIDMLNSANPWPCGSSLTELISFTPSSEQAVKSLENLICFDAKFQKEWKEYLDEKNATLYKTAQWNSTRFAPHSFLKFASVLDRTVNSFAMIGEIAQNTLNDTDVDRLSVMSAWKYTLDNLNTTDKDDILGKFFTKVDTVLNSISSKVDSNVTLNALWEKYLNCSSNVYLDEECSSLGRAAWTNTFKFISLAVGNVTGDINTYLREANGANATLLQQIGFTSRTALYTMYDKMPELIEVLINSYWDYNFMQQLRRATLIEFWDCDAVLGALNPGPGSSITTQMLQSFQPYVCPSMLYWLSMPTGANSLLDVFTKPQFLFFTLPVSKFESAYDTAYTSVTNMSNILFELSNSDAKLNISLDSLKSKLENFVDKLITYKITTENPSYREFNDIMKRQTVSIIYLTRTAAISNKIFDLLTTLKIEDVVNNLSEEDKRAIQGDISSLKRLFKRRTSDIIAIHFDVITDVLWTNRNDYKITNALEIMCDNLKNNDTSKQILADNVRIKGIVCSKQYKIIYSALQHVMEDGFEDTRTSLLNVVKVLQNGSKDDVSNIFTLFNDNQAVVSALKKTTTYATDLDLSIYVQYLHSSIEHYNVVLDFLTGGDWWRELRGLYTGEQSKKFLDSVENSIEIIDDVLNNLDQIHLVRLLHDINFNDTDAFCQPNITLSDYIPDKSGIFSELHRQLCGDKKYLFKEIPPLLFASQGYDDELAINSSVNYYDLNADITKAESKLSYILEGPLQPLVPDWITDENVAKFRASVLNILSKETLTKIAFGIMSNAVDGATLYLDNTYCPICSQVTSWVKQITLQLYKKQEYESLLCAPPEISAEQINAYFHWDMAITELISTRNYTKLELNKSLNELLEQIKLNLLDDITANNTKMAECLAANLNKNHFSTATIATTLISRILLLFRIYVPHLQYVQGFSTIPYIKHLESDIVNNLDVYYPLDELIEDKDNLAKELHFVTDLNTILKDSSFNLRKAKDFPLKRSSFKMQKRFCKLYNCTKVIAILTEHLSEPLVSKMVSQLPDLQRKSFWRFEFISDVLASLETVLEHTSSMLRRLSMTDMEGVLAGRISSLLDLFMQVLVVDSSDWIESIEGIFEEAAPLLGGTDLDSDIAALTDGLHVLVNFRDYIVDKDVKITISKLFKSPENIEMSLKNVGLNSTDFWKTAPSVHKGEIHLKPILSTKSKQYNITSMVCEQNTLSQILTPGDLNDISTEQFYTAIQKQYCGMKDDQVKKIIPVLIENVNFTYVLDEVKSFLLEKFYASSNLTAEEGSNVFGKVSDMAELLPLVQKNVGNLTDTLAREPLIQKLKGGFSIGSVMSSPDILADVGNMMCGKPFFSGISRFYKTIVSSVDLSSDPDEAQLQVLPTEFCRSMYKDIVSIDGGKIVWSFIKPLLMGKILYTPPSPAVQQIIEKANSTFSPMVKMFEVVHSFAHAFSSIERLSSHKAGVRALQEILATDEYRSIREALLGDVAAPNVDVDALLDEIGDSEGLGRLLGKASDMMRCVNLDRFKPARDEHHLSVEAAKLTTINEFTAGLVFLNMSDNEVNIPDHIEYKIRMDIENAPTTKRTKNYLWTPGPESSFLENMRYFRGFIQVQDIIEKAIIQVSTPNRTKREVSDEMDWAIYTQQNPYPCYTKDLFQSSLYESQALIVAFFFSLLFTVSSAVRFILADKESGNTMLMTVMGVELRYHTLSWFVVSLVEMSVTMSLVSCVLHYGRILPRTAPSLIFALLFVFGLSVLSFCYLMGKLFTSASVGAVCAALAYLTTFMPFILILSLEAVLSSTLKIFVSLSMSSSLCYAFLLIGRFEAMGVGTGWAHVWATPDNTDINIAVAAIMMMVDACLYLAIGYLVEMFWGFKKVQSNVTYLPTTEEKAGVSIINITKVYPRATKPALSGVSVELRPGQVTTLLGHNGAGKSTLINILTGMVRPTSGQVVIRGRGGRVGVCPQRDVLYERLTAREHVHLYARLNDAPEDEVDSILDVLSLGAVGARQARQLSGGTRRRLCVALAFVGRARLVTLDEPTSGVDPTARKEIWSMILKLRAGRTILLTTHHLDEAELLSDQLVILHKGQVHTTGSPIEIKRSLGSGYKLTVTFDKNEPQDMEDNTNKVLDVARNVVKNATLQDVSAEDIEVNVPFYDEHGVSNDFEALCRSVEESERWLGYRCYSMECTSLEQVFYNVSRHDDRDDLETTSKSASTSSIKTDKAPLVPPEGPLKGSTMQQFMALLRKRYMNYIRNKWLLFLLICLPSLFVSIAMGFATIRPPADNEIALPLTPRLYDPTTDYMIPYPTSSENMDQLAQNVLDILRHERHSRNWTSEDSLTCKCVDAAQQCEIRDVDRPEMMLLPNTETLNDWLVTSQQVYIEKRYGGYTSTVRDNSTYLTAWYNNKGHHALPAYVSALNAAVLRARSHSARNITLYTHPLKISNEQLNKDNVYQHIADAGISALLVIGYSLVSAGGAIYLVHERASSQKRLQLLAAVSPALYWTTALLADMIVILINLAITVVILKIFNFPVFVARNNLPAICLLIVLYGYGCAGVVHVLEKWFSEASLANMVLFCGNTFVALSGIALLLVLDIISDSDATDNARWVLHKVLLLSPQFVLADGLLEVAKNTIQSQVLGAFGMDTYRDPLGSSLLALHYGALAAVGTALFLLNLAIEYRCFDALFDRFSVRYVEPRDSNVSVDEDVAREERRVEAAVAPLRLRTIGNINAGFVDSKEDLKSNSLKRAASVHASDVVSCAHVSRAYGARLAVQDLTLGIPQAQCTALLGQNGAGKSSTFAMLTGELRPSAGRLYVRDERALQRHLCRGIISYCPQRDALDPLLTVRETLQFFCQLRGLTCQDEVIRRTIDQFELNKYAEVRSGALSGGNKRKLCAAVAFMGRNPLVLLDEPTSGMDPGSRGCVSRAWVSACAQGRGVLVSTHALQEARRAHRVALLRGGRLAALAPLDHSIARFGGGYVICARVCGRAREVWSQIRTRLPHATLTVAHDTAIHFIVPTIATVGEKEVVTAPSAVFRSLGALQRDGLLDDYTINHTSLEQMFSSCSGEGAFTLEDSPAPSPSPSPSDNTYRRASDDLTTVTSL